jgi:endonuclease I
MKNLIILMMIFTAMNAWSSVFDNQAAKLDLTKLTRIGHKPLTSYSKSREFVLQQLDIKQDKKGYFVEDVYCQIKFREKISPRSMPKHTEINIEHTWPQSRFNKRQSRSHQKADLHHLYPTESVSNSTRGNIYFGEFDDAEPINHNCSKAKSGHFSSTGKTGFEPPNKHKGNVARALFYFSARYEIRIPDHEEFFLRQWHLMDPVDQDEIERNDIIESIQGNRNPFVDDSQLINSITDF